MQDHGPAVHELQPDAAAEVLGGHRMGDIAVGDRGVAAHACVEGL